jgi:hypothetical protein
VSGGDPTTGAAQLAERILEEVTMPNQDWCNIAALARELAVLAESAAPGGERRPRTEEP